MSLRGAGVGNVWEGDVTISSPCMLNRHWLRDCRAALAMTWFLFLIQRIRRIFLSYLLPPHGIIQTFLSDEIGMFA
jgi:hypothetical protein